MLQAGRVIADAPPESAIQKYLESAQNQTDDLLLRKDRNGSGTVRASGLVLYGEDGRATRQVRCGENVEIALHYLNRIGSDLKQVGVGIGLFDLYGRAVTFAENRPLGVRVAAMAGGGTFRCRIPRFRLTPGRYWINCAIYHGTDLCDEVEHAAICDVVEGDFFGTGKLTYTGSGGVLVEQEWDADTSPKPMTAC